MRCAMRSTVVAAGVTATVAGSRSICLARSAISCGMVAETRPSGARFAAGDDPDVVAEAHVEHAVDFVKDEHLDVAEGQRVLFTVEQAAGRRHQHIDAVLQRRGLRRPSTDAADGEAPEEMRRCRP